MSDQGWNTPQDPNTGQEWGNPPPGGQAPPPPNPAGDWGQAPGANPPPPQWGQQPPPPGQQVPGQQVPPQQSPPQQWGQQPQPTGQPADQWGQQPQANPQQQWGEQPQQSGGIDPPIAGVLAYFFGWVGGLVIYLVNKDNLSRFHGAQSILLSISVGVLSIAIVILSFIFAFISGTLATLLTFLNFGVILGFFGISIFLAIKAYQGERTVLPVIGPVAESWASK